MILGTLAFARFDATLLLLLGDDDPTPGDWSVWARACGEAASEHAVRRLLFVTNGGGPNAAQLREVQSSLVRAVGTDAAEVFTTAACGDSPMARFVAAALGWLYAGCGVKTFADDEQREALRFLGLAEARHPEILAAISHLQTALRGRTRGKRA